MLNSSVTSTWIGALGAPTPGDTGTSVPGAPGVPSVSSFNSIYRGERRNDGKGGEGGLRLGGGGGSGIAAFPPGVFGLHDFICEAIINFLNEISN